MYLRSPNMYTIKAILILDCSGRKILTKYYDQHILSSLKEQSNLETGLVSKCTKEDKGVLGGNEGVMGGNVMAWKKFSVVYKSNADLYFYVLGNESENMMLLDSVLLCVYGSISKVLRKQVDKQTLMNNIEMVMLIVDEAVDRGIVLETDSNNLLDKISLKTDNFPNGEQTLAQIMESAKQQLMESAKQQLHQYKASFFR